MIKQRRRNLVVLFLTAILPCITTYQLKGLRGQILDSLQKGIQLSEEEIEVCTRIKNGSECHAAMGGGVCAFCTLSTASPATFEDVDKPAIDEEVEGAHHSKGICLPAVAFGVVCPREGRLQLQYH